MKVKLVLLLTAFFFACPIFGQSNSTKRIAMIETVNQGGDVPSDIILKVRTKLAQVIASTSGYDVYDRGKLADALKSSSKPAGTDGNSYNEKSVDMAKVDYILHTEVASMRDNKVFITAKLLDKETACAEGLSYVTTATDTAAMENACRKLADELFGNYSVEETEQ